MFKKIEELGSFVQQNKSSQKSIRLEVSKQYTDSNNYMELLFPKQGIMQIQKIKSEYKTELIYICNQIKFFQKEKYVYPTLHLLHQFPSMLPKFQVDLGAIKFVLSGANIMAPGLTSKGGKLPEQFYPVGTVVGIYAENKENALAVGATIQTTDEIKTQSKGIAIEVLHYLGDALWQLSAQILQQDQASDVQQKEKAKVKQK